MSLAFAESPATYERRRARALAAGPGDTAVAAELASLFNDDAEILSADGSLTDAQYTQLDQLLVAAYRSGDWTRYGQERAAFIDARLHMRAEENARAEQEHSWRDADEYMAGAA
jgi:hypothetical protein